MGFSDNFHFDEADYVLKLQSLSDQELRSREVRAYRQHVTSSASIGSGLGFAFLTGGVSLLGSAYGGRRLYLAKKKLELIQDELKKRGLESHEPTKRDFFIPLGISVATMGLGAGIDAVAAHATSGIAAHAVAHHGSQAIHDAVNQPNSFVRGVGEGISTQFHETADLITVGMQHATSVATTDSYFLVAGSPYLPAGELVGVAAGESLALSAEQKLACFVSEKIAFRLVNASSGTKSQAITYFNPSDGCRRIKRPLLSLVCDHCGSAIHTDKEVYYRKIQNTFPKYLTTNLA